MPSALALALAVLWAFVGARISVSRGRSKALGAILGFLLGPIGLLVTRLLPKGASTASLEPAHRSFQLSRSAPAALVPVVSGAPADWYTDPWGEAPLRYWSGSEWTGHTR